MVVNKIKRQIETRRKKGSLMPSNAIADKPSHVDVLNTKDNKVLWNAISADPELLERANKIFTLPLCELEPSFLGFVGAYRRLAEIIPPDWTVYDLGCCHAFQSWYFRNHAAYVGVDLLTNIENRLAIPNACHFKTSIKNFLAKFTHTNRMSFAICHYVPPWDGGSGELVRQKFDNCFVFYPEHNGSLWDFFEKGIK